MNSPLFIPELRELLYKKDIKGIQDFCSSTHPGTAARMQDGAIFEG